MISCSIYKCFIDSCVQGSLLNAQIKEKVYISLAPFKVFFLMLYLMYVIYIYIYVCLHTCMYPIYVYNTAYTVYISIYDVP